MVGTVSKRNLRVREYIGKMLIFNLARLYSVKLQKHIVDDLQTKDRIMSIARMTVNKISLPTRQCLELTGCSSRNKILKAAHYLSCMRTVLYAARHHSLKLCEQAAEVSLSEQNFVGCQLFDYGWAVFVDVCSEEESLFESCVNSLRSFVIFHRFADRNKEVC